MGPSGLSFRDRQSATLKSAGIGLCAYKMDGTVQYIDEVVLNQLELSELYPNPLSVQGKNLSELIASANLDGFFPEKIRTQRRVRDNQLLIKTLAGNEKWLLHDLDLSLDVDSGEEVIHATLRIINRLKITENRLRESENRYRKLFESSPYGILLIDLEARALVNINPAALEMYGMTFKQIYSTSFKQLFCMNIMELIDRGIHNDEKNAGIAQLFEGSIFPLDRPALSVEVHGLPLNYENNRYLQLTIINISQRKSAEEEKLRLIAKLTQSLLKVKKLSGLLPICSCCKKIRNDEGYWEQVEGYIEANSEASFSHGLCPQCAHNLYPDIVPPPGKSEKGGL